MFSVLCDDGRSNWLLEVLFTFLKMFGFISVYGSRNLYCDTPTGREIVDV